MVYKYFIVILFITLTITNAQDNSNCYKKGAYVSLLNDLTKQESADSCANHCISQSKLSCQYFTFDPTTNLCETFAFSRRFGINSIDAVFCPNCLSGNRNNFCWAQGFCKVNEYKNFKIYQQ